MHLLSTASRNTAETRIGLKPLPGIEADIVDENGKPVPLGKRRRFSCNQEALAGNVSVTLFNMKRGI